jgi:hypothetical protein
MEALRVGKKPRNNKVWMDTKKWRHHEYNYDSIGEFLREFSIHWPEIPLDFTICCYLDSDDEANWNLLRVPAIQELWRECEVAFPKYSKHFELCFMSSQDTAIFQVSGVAACLDQITIPFQGLQISEGILDGAMESLAVSIAKHTQLEKVSIYNCSTRRDLIPVAAAVAALPQLKKIQFCVGLHEDEDDEDNDDVNCDERALTQAAFTIAQSTSVEELVLFPLYLSQDLQALIQHLQSMPTLKTLQLHPSADSCWSNLQIFLVAQLLQTSLSLENFIFDCLGHVLDNVSMVPFTTALRTNTKLRSLDLGFGDGGKDTLGPIDLKALAGLLESNNYILERLSIGRFVLGGDPNQCKIRTCENSYLVYPPLDQATEKNMNNIMFWLALNKNGQRKRLLSSTPNTSHEDWVGVIAEHKEHVPAVYYYLSINVPLLVRNAALLPSPPMAVHEEAGNPAGSDEPPRKRRRGDM